MYRGVHGIRFCFSFISPISLLKSASSVIKLLPVIPEILSIIFWFIFHFHLVTWDIAWSLGSCMDLNKQTDELHEGVFKSFRTGRLARELQMVQLSDTRFSCIAILWVSVVSFAAITFLCCFSTSVCCLFRYRLSPETFGYTLVSTVSPWWLGPA
jgi:hypothetical protein